MTACRDTAPSSLAEVECFRGAYCASETSVNFNEATERYIPESYHVYKLRRENLKSQIGRISHVIKNHLLDLVMSNYTDSVSFSRYSLRVG
jgi:hypothetical protein